MQRQRIRDSLLGKAQMGIEQQQCFQNHHPLAGPERSTSVLKKWKETDDKTKRHKCALRDLDLAGSALFKEAIKAVFRERYALKDGLVCMGILIKCTRGVR